MIFKTLDKLARFKQYAPICIRFIFFLYLILAVKAQVYLPSNVEKFSENLGGMGFPFPLFFAYLASWSVFIAYILVTLGWKVRLAAVPLVIYFSVAVFVYHVPAAHGISKTMPATVMLAMSLFLLLNGAGKLSIDEGI